MNTLCPKIGAAQWTCTRDECTCHLKETIPERRAVVDLSADELNAHAVAAFNEAARVGAAIACATAASPRPPYEKAIKHRPRGACYCDLDDRACYAAGHWESGCTWTDGPCRTVRCTNCPFYSSGLRN